MSKASKIGNESDAAQALDLTDLIGTKFADGGRTPEVGLDCAGVALDVLERLDIPAPHALRRPLVAAATMQARDGWGFIGTDPALAWEPGRLLIGDGAEFGSQHVWVSIGGGDVATSNRRLGFRIYSIGNVLERVRAVYGFDPMLFGDPEPLPVAIKREWIPPAPPAPTARRKGAR